MQHIKKVFSLAALFVVAGFLLWGLPVFAEYGLEETAGAAGLYKPDVNKPLPVIVGDIIGTALSFISVIFFILMLYGGFLWMTSRGNSDQESKARDTIFGAVIGIIIVLAAYAITSFVFKNLAPATGSPDSPGGGASKCEQSYASYGLSCNKIADCQGGDAVQSVQAAHTKEKVGTYNGDSIVGLCPGAADIVCCIAK